MPAPIDLTGRVVGRLTVLYRAKIPSRGGRMWVCACRCGRQSVVKASYLNKEKTRSCGCAFADAAQMRNIKKFRDLTGKRFGRLLVLDSVFKRFKVMYWQCICDCGSEMIINGHSLKQGLTKSCGCLQRECASEARKRACATQPRRCGRFAKAA
jgi:hypothetical protein